MCVKRFLPSIFLLVLSLSLSWAGEDYYKLLGIDRTADQRDIRKAFKKLAVSEHPDKKTDDPDAHEKFIKFTTAYEVLKDPELRKKYDLYGEDGLDADKRRGNYRSYTYYQHNFGIYDDDPQIVTLNSNDYFDSVLDSEKMWFINFYSPQCSHCHHLAPVWRKIAKDLEGVIRVGAVNCEDDWHLCSQLGIKSYPTLMYYLPQSKSGIHHNGGRTYEKIMQFVLDKIDVEIQEIKQSTWRALLKGKGLSENPILVFVCGESRYCFTVEERKRIAAIFDKMIDIKLLECDTEICGGGLSDTTGVAYFPPQNLNSKHRPVLFEDVLEVEDVVRKVLEQLPEPQDISEERFNKIMNRMSKKDEEGWLLCFYIGHARDFDVLLKQLPSMMKDVNLAKINCGRYSGLCKDLNVNHYPAWGVLKPGGAFELSHGKSTMNGVLNFAKSSLKARNMWALSAEKIHSIMKRANGEAWFLDWYAPWCPPCMKFLPEVRKASLQFDASVLRFGTIDCTVHSNICQQYNIRSYPTAMLVNGSSTSYVSANHRTARFISEFIKEAMDPTVIHLTVDNFNKKLVKKRFQDLWVVDYFAPWCGPCQQFAPEWTKVAKALKDLTYVKIASVDCVKEQSICIEQNIRSYPTIRLYFRKTQGIQSFEAYNGQRDHIAVLRWISLFLPVKVKEIEDWELRREVLEADNAVLVDFYAPWCGHCTALEPQFAIAAQMLQHKVKFIRLNCDLYQHTCGKANVRSYPTLKLYASEEDRQSLQGGLKLRSTTAAQIRDEVLEVLPSKYVLEHDEL